MLKRISGIVLSLNFYCLNQDKYQCILLRHMGCCSFYSVFQIFQLDLMRFALVWKLWIFSVKKHPNLKGNVIFLYLRQVFE